MKNISCSTLVKTLVANFLVIAIFVTSSMVALANQQPLMGELIVSDVTTDGNAPFALVNGERASNGRTVLSSATVSTPATSSATINLGKLGRIELAPNSSVSLDFNDNSISANLASGQVKVLNAAGVDAKVVTKDGSVNGDSKSSNVFAVNLSSGTTEAVAETGVAYLNNASGTKKLGQDTDSSVSGAEVWVPVAVVAGLAAVTLIWVYTRDDDELRVVSPVR